MDDQQLLRYSRQIMLPELDIRGQELLLASTVLIVGAGGLGSPVALYLAGAGVGHLVIADDDAVETSNLQRQIAHCDADVGRNKAASAASAAQARNADVQVEVLDQRLSGTSLEAHVRRADLVIDATDNFATRFAINTACVTQHRPLVSAAVIRWELQVTTFLAGGRPCYRCLFAEADDGRQTCSETGVVGPLPGIGGTYQAVEAIKVLTGAGEPLHGRLLLLDALRMRQRTLSVPADPGCPVCATSPSAGR